MLANAECYSCGQKQYVNPASHDINSIPCKYCQHLNLGWYDYVTPLQITAAAQPNFGDVFSHSIPQLTIQEPQNPIEQLEEDRDYWRSKARKLEKDKSAEREEKEIAIETQNKIRKEFDPKFRRLSQKDSFFPFDDYGKAWVE